LPRRKLTLTQTEMEAIVACTIIARGKHTLFLNDRPVDFLMAWAYRRCGWQIRGEAFVDIIDEQPIENINSASLQLVTAGHYTVFVDPERVYAIRQMMWEHFHPLPNVMTNSSGQFTYTGIRNRAGTNHRHIPIRVMAIMVFLGRWESVQGHVRLAPL
jgi:hypothetical protein